jgi:hypothetical protein
MNDAASPAPRTTATSGATAADPVLDTHLTALHQDVLETFERLEPVYDLADRLLDNWSGNARGPEAQRRSLADQSRSVRALELVMPIVAPMKAGKSTLINAIVGYQLLPARANPMTTLPTRIVLVDGKPLDQPELIIPASLAEIYDRMAEAVRGPLKAGETAPEGHSYLDRLAAEIADGGPEPLRERYVGTEQVHQILARLNDQIRLAGFIAGEVDFLSEVTELPTLETGFLHDYPAGDSRGGRLVIIDTPGPNEYAIAAQLGPVLETQLARSHMVLTVLDYTQMGADAARDIQVRLTPLLKIIGSSHLYAVVNKVDARKTEDDLNKADTRRAALHSLGLTEGRDDGRVFETIAHLGVVGSRVLADARLGVPGLTTGPSARALMRERLQHATDDEIDEELADLGEAGVLRLAERMIAKSQVPELIGSAIMRLRAGAGPAVIDAGVRHHLAAVDALREVLNLTASAAERDQRLVRDQLARLDAESKVLIQLRERQPTIAQLQKQFRRQLDDFLKWVAHAGQETIATLDPDSARDDDAILPEAARATIRASKKLMSRLMGREGGTAAADRRVFSTKAEGEAFIERVTLPIVSQLRQLLDIARRELDTVVQRMTAEVVAEQEQRARPVIERAAATLRDAFAVSLKVPPPAVVDGELAVELGAPTVSTYYTTEKYQTTEMKRNPWTLGITKREVTVTREREVSHATYVVTRADVKAQLTDAFAGKLVQLEVDLDSYVAGNLSAAIDEYFRGLDQFLQRYRGALAASQAENQQDEQQRDRVRAELAALVAMLDAEQPRLAGYLHQMPRPAA